MKKILLTLVIVLGIGAGVGLGGNITKALNHASDNHVLSSQSQSDTTQTPPPTKEVSQPGTPQTIEIPTLNIKTNIESVGNDAQGRMDVPKENANTAWYSPGFRPGVNGNAVLAGHYDKADGSPSVFHSLGKLGIGDQIIVTDDKGKAQKFAVTKKTKYPDADFPISLVFGSATEPMLNLITCHGTWNKQTKNYSERMVVYSKLVN